MDMIVDASNCVLGRLASCVGKELIKGKKVAIINAERAIISGNPVYIRKDYKERVAKGDPYHGPFYPRRPDMIVKRVVRGMLPKNTKGREALKKLKVYISVPESLKGKKAVRIGAAENKLKCKSTELGKLSDSLGATVTW